MVDMMVRENDQLQVLDAQPMRGERRLERCK
jgi:hypothetical protein